MLSSISPFGERSRQSRWWLTVSAYLIGSVAGGATTGLVFGSIGGLLPISASAGLAILATAAVFGLAADLRVRGLSVPSLHRQVNEDWLTTYRGWIYGLGFGYQLGLGLATIVATSTVWLVWIAALARGSWLAGLAIGALFGFARGALIFATARAQEPAQLRDLFTSIAASAPQVHRTAVVAAGLVAATAVGGLLV